MIRLWISITAIQNEIFKSSKDSVLCICINFNKSFLYSIISCKTKALLFKMLEGVATFTKILNFRELLQTLKNAVQCRNDDFNVAGVAKR